MIAYQYIIAENFSANCEVSDLCKNGDTRLLVFEHVSMIIS